MYTALTFRLYPNRYQLSMFYRTSGSCRWLYNKCLAHKIRVYNKKDTILSKNYFINQLPTLKTKYPWLSEVPSQALQQSLIDMEKAYQNFFKGNARYPKFKKYSDKRSFRLPQHCEVSILNQSLYLPKIGHVKAKGNFHLYQFEPVQSITVSQDSDGKWYASVLIKKDTTNYFHIHEYQSCGIDIGIKKPLTVSYVDTDGKEKHKFIGKKFSKELAKKENRRKKYQRQYARKQKGSKNQEKAKRKLAKAFYREKECRKNFIEQTSYKLASKFETVVFEDLKLKNMTRSAKGTVEEPGTNVRAKSGLNREMLRLGHGSLVLRTEQKTRKFQGTFLRVDPRRTSQECRKCGHTCKENRKGSVFLCIKCSHTEHADVNAGFNILDKGLKLVA